MTRKEYVLNNFEENFSKYRNANIVLFGLGYYAEEIIRRYTEYNIIGLLDRWLNTGECFGKNIMSYSDLLDKKISVIIIAASCENTQVIYDRIGRFCWDNDIMLFSLEGELLNNRLSEDEKLINDLYGRFSDCIDIIKTESEKKYWSIIEKRFFGGEYEIDKKGKLHIKSAYDIGFLFLGPLITDFVLWLKNVIKERNIKKIYFVSRDGYLLNSLYNELRKKKGNDLLPEADYLLTSRYVCMLGGIKTEEDIVACINVNFTGDAKMMLKQRFLLTEEEINTIEVSNNLSIKDYVLCFKNIIFEKAHKIRTYYKEYLRQLGVQESCFKKVLFFDLVASGTCQKTVEELMECKFQGVYLMRMPSCDVKKQELDIMAYKEFDEEFAARSMFLESILTSIDTTLLYIDENYKPVFSKETRKQSELDYIVEAQEGIRDYFLKYIEECEKYLEYKQSEFPIEIYNHVISYYTVIESEVFSNYVIQDEIFNEENNILNKCMV